VVRPDESSGLAQCARGPWSVIRGRLGGSRPEVGSWTERPESPAVIEVGTGIKRTRRCQEFSGRAGCSVEKGGATLPFFCQVCDSKGF